MKRFAAFLGIVASLGTQPARAWGDLGHRMVCDRTWEELTEEARAKVLDILDLKTQEEFADSCNWADAYREEHRETGPWHYISVPKGARDVSVERDCPIDTSCAVREIDRQFQILISAAPKAERAMALKFLAHFVGDLHQPLHTGYAEDRRGSMIPVQLLGKEWSMHGIWDYALVESPPMGTEFLRPATRVDRTFADVNAPPIRWATESLDILRSAATSYVGNPGGLKLDEVYIQQNRPIAMERIAQAGVRLAHRLEQAMRHWP